MKELFFKKVRHLYWKKVFYTVLINIFSVNWIHLIFVILPFPITITGRWFVIFPRFLWSFLIFLMLLLFFLRFLFIIYYLVGIEKKSIFMFKLFDRYKYKRKTRYKVLSNTLILRTYYTKVCVNLYWFA